jgi:hypothetical protein
VGFALIVLDRLAYAIATSPDVDPVVESLELPLPQLISNGTMTTAMSHALKVNSVFNIASPCFLLDRLRAKLIVIGLLFGSQQT